MSDWKIRDQSIIDGGVKDELKEYNKLLIQLLFNRGIKSKTDIENFLHPLLSKLPSITKWKNLEKVVGKINKAIDEKKKIYIWGDYDADGICATSILWEYLYNEKQANVLPFIPDRLNEGYGVTKTAIKRLSKREIDLIITVDCGIRDKEAIEYAQKKGIEVIVTDHHKLPQKKDLPKCLLLHQDLNNCDEFSGLSGAGVAWFLISGFIYYKDKENFSYLSVPGIDLVALTILSDSMPAVGINRILLFHGIATLRTTKRVGLNLLMKHSKVDKLELTSRDLQFGIIPKINSTGRIGDPLDSVRLLITSNSQTAQKYVSRLDEVNNRRKTITEEVYKECLLDSNKIVDDSVFASAGNNWAAGVIGIVAGKINLKFHKLALVLSKSETESVGSIRGIDGISIIETLNRLSGYLVRYGGYDQAAGFTIKNDQIDPFVKHFNEIVKKELHKLSRLPTYVIDLVLSVDDLHWKTYLTINLLRPFGYLNEVPLIMLQGVNICNMKVVGKTHLSFVARGIYNETRCIAFGLGYLYSKLRENGSYDIIGNLEVNKWNDNENLQFNVKEIRTSI